MVNSVAIFWTSIVSCSILLTTARWAHNTLRSNGRVERRGTLGARPFRPNLEIIAFANLAHLTLFED
jgi:hypothetical protein